jgi:Mycothiol maleylpyruvate isomerase N-terminal domain
VLSRDEALKILEEGQAELDQLFARLDEAAMMRPATIGGGEWSAKDLMGHIAFWEELALEAIDASRARRGPAVDEFKNADEANAHNQRNTAPQSLTQIHSRAAGAHNAILGAIRAMSDTEWATLGEKVGGILGGPRGAFDHAWAHLDDLQKYVESTAG